MALSVTGRDPSCFLLAIVLAPPSNYRRVNYGGGRRVNTGRSNSTDSDGGDGGFSGSDGDSSGDSGGGDGSGGE